ncbi:MAG: aminotransferase class I/II-fold pyridoxal phosphate-dependent enzyme [Candidatus Aminicenantaceae bacterium]
MKKPRFAMERWQSEWEHHVRFNLGESGVHPLRLDELVPAEERDALFGTELAYLQTDGTSELKQSIAGLYPGAVPNNVLVTTGSIEANFQVLWHLLEPDDRILFMRPNFLQMQGLAESFGAHSVPFYLKEPDWDLDLDEVSGLCSEGVKLIVVTDPNNPAGSLLSLEQRRGLEELAARAGAWLVVDEVYLGAELDGNTLPSWWGAYPKTIVTCGLSKAYGLPGLRVGWIVAPPEIVQSCWAGKDYTSISISALSERLAVRALQPEKRAALLERTRNIIRPNWEIFATWMQDLDGMLSCVPTRAGAVAFPRYHLDINSSRMAQRLKEERSVLICPGDHFGLDGFFRIGLGNPAAEFSQALGKVAAGLRLIRDQGA